MSISIGFSEEINKIQFSIMGDIYQAQKEIAALQGCFKSGNIQSLTWGSMIRVCPTQFDSLEKLEKLLGQNFKESPHTLNESSEIITYEFVKQHLPENKGLVRDLEIKKSNSRTVEQYDSFDNEIESLKVSSRRLIADAISKNLKNSYDNVTVTSSRLIK